MKWSNLKIGMKLAIGFGSLLVLILVGGYVGYSGLKTVDRSMVIVTDEEAPVVDTAMEMKISLMRAMSAMDEYMAATSVIAASDEGKLGGLVTAYEAATLTFDRGVEAILKGGDLNGVKVVATDNAELAGLVRQAAELHNSRYDATAKELIADGKALLVRKAEKDTAMVAMETVFDEMNQESAAFEGLVASEISKRAINAHIGQAALAILREEIPVADMAMEMKFAVANARIALEEFVQSQDPAELDVIEKELHQSLAAFDQMAKAVLKGGIVDGEEIIATDNTQIRAAVQALDKNHEAFQEKAKAMIAAHRALLTQTDEVNETMARLDNAGVEASTLLSNVETLAGREMDTAKASGYASSARAMNWQIVVVLASILIGVFLGVVITRGLTKNINQGVVMAQEIAKGDFSQRLNLHRKDEIGVLADALDGMAVNLQKKADLAETIADGNLNVKVELASEKDQLGLSLQRMTDSLNEILGQVQTATEQIATGGGQVSDASQSLSQGATESAASLEEITSSMNVMASQTRQNAENSGLANRLSDEALSAAEKGNGQMQNMVKAMAEINDASQNISRIIKTIDEIAFQTNLLALNAAVEAARAGQHGKGFAVVAEEVRNLAARSAKAAEETAQLIEGSVEKTGNGTRIASQTAEALGEIVSGIGKVSDLVADISASSNEQADGIAQVDIGLTQIDQVTQQNTASAEESAAAAEELAGQAESLRHLLTRFTLRQHAGSYQRPPATPVANVGWTDAKKYAVANSAPGYPQPEISLDDSDFGKY
jgi:methyl-accepting chemotaxis protein